METIAGVLTTEVRRAGKTDLRFVLDAQIACAFDMDTLPSEQVMEGLRTGQLRGYVLWVENVRRAFLSTSIDGESAMLSSLYRVGPPLTFASDVNAILFAVREDLHRHGVKRMYCCISRSNPRFQKLLRHYERLEFKQDMVRMSQDV